MTIHRLLLAQILFLMINFQIIHASSIMGGVKDDLGRPLSGVNITIQNKNIGTTSNQFGLFSIENLNNGSYTLSFNYVGYKSIQIKVELEGSQIKKQNIILTEDILKMDALLVTVQKRVEQIQEVPITMSVIDGPFLQQNGQVNLDVLSGFVPGINIHSQSNNRPNFVIRGLTSDAFLASAQPRVSVFYNNIPISRNTGALIKLFDIDRIEVLKGPQGTLFGRGAQIGSVSLISKKPENTFLGTFSIGLGNQGQQIYNGMINLPITEKLFSRFAVVHSQNDGFVKNTFGGQLNHEKTSALRSSFRYFPGSRTIIDLVHDYQEDRPGGTAFMSRTYPNQKGKIDVFDDTASFERGQELGLDRKINSFNFNVHHYFNTNLDLNSFISYREHQADEIWDGDGSAAPALNFEENTEVKQFTFESRLNFAIGHRFNAFAGISFWSEEVDQTVRFSPNEQSLFFLFTDPRGLVDEQGNPNFIQTIPAIPEFGELGGFPLPTDHVEESFQQAGSQAVEAFIDGTYSLSKRIKLTAGLRIVSDHLSLDARNNFLSGQPSTLGYLTGNAPNVLIAPGEVSDTRKSYKALVGRIIARYSINENFKSYLGYARGRRPNVIQLRADAQAEILDDEKVNNYEIGIKGTIADQILLDAAAFYYDYNDFQTRSWVADQESGEYQLIVKDGGKAHAYGFESNLRYAVNKNIKINANYAYIHARFDKTDSNGDEQEFEGNKFRLTPHHTWSFRAHFNRDLLDMARLFVVPFYSFKSHHYFEDDNRNGLEQNGYGVLNLQSGVYYKPLHLELSFFVYNVFDKEYLVSAGNAGNLFGIPTFVPGTPLTFSVKIKWDF